MNDRDLLEMAAKAAGVIGVWATAHQTYGDQHIEGIDSGARFWWNPLADDGDALRLAVKLGFAVSVCKDMPTGDFTCVLDVAGSEFHDGDPYAATRRAIVRAAAEIGKATP